MKKVLIVFSGAHFAYSPTTLNIFNSLRSKGGFDVTVLADEPSDQFSLQRVVDERVHYIKNNPKKSFLEKVAVKLKGFIRSEDDKKKNTLLNRKAKKYIKAISQYDVDLIIAVDFFCLWCVQQLNKSAHLVSLEILENDPYYNACDLSKVRSVAIQSIERYDYLFKSAKPPISILPNSPFYDEFVPSYDRRKKNDLLFCGSAVPEFGIFSCLDFLVDYPEYRLTVKGAVPPQTKAAIELFYNELLKDGRLVLNDTYMSSEELNRYLSTFWVGLVFYDFYRFQTMRRFNYYTAPSGKLYQYFNAGVPVIGNELVGFEIVNTGQAGKLVNCLSSMQIKNALDAIESDYLQMANNAKKISVEFDLRKYMDEYIEKLNDIN